MSIDIQILISSLGFTVKLLLKNMPYVLHLTNSNSKKLKN